MVFREEGTAGAERTGEVAEPVDEKQPAWQGSAGGPPLADLDEGREPVENVLFRETAYVVILPPRMVTSGPLARGGIDVDDVAPRRRLPRCVAVVV